MNKPKITFAIAIYNIENNMLIECIESIINQNIDEIEVLLISDNTCAENLKLINEYSEKDQRIRVVHNKCNRGLAFVRNQSIEEAKGEYICFVDQDDELEDGVCREAYDKAISNDADIVMWTYKTRVGEMYKNTNYYGPKECIYESEMEISKLRMQILDPTYIGEQQIPMLMTVWAKLYKLDFLKNNSDVRFPVEFRKGGEDYSFSYRIFGRAKKILFFENYGYIYRQIGNSMTKKYRKNEWENRKVWIRDIESNLPAGDAQQKIAFYRFCLNEVISQCVVTQLHPDANMSFGERKKELKVIRNEMFVREALANLSKLGLKKSKYIYFLTLKSKCYSVNMLLSRLYRKKIYG